MRHARFVAGGTGAGTSTVCAILAARYDVHVYDGDRAEHDRVRRCTPERHPRLRATARGVRPWIASGLGLPVVTVDGRRSPDEVTDELAVRFRLAS